MIEMSFMFRTTVCFFCVLKLKYFGTLILFEIGPKLNFFLMLFLKQILFYKIFCV
ncbi:hypothetical protein IC582_018928 [Cucumis melo]